MRDAGLGGGRALAADHLDLAAAHVVRITGTSPPGPLRCGSTTCKRESGGDGGVEGVAALLQRRHADGGRDPMGRGHDAEGALDLGTGGEAGSD